jgi:hypothetical protein
MIARPLYHDRRYHDVCMGDPDSQTVEIDGLETRRFQMVLRVLFGALCATQAIYVAIAYLVVGRATSERPWERAAPNPTLVWVFVGVAAATVAMIPVLRRKLLPRGARAVEGVDRAPKVPAVRALGRYMSGQILSWALCEAVGVYGLIVAFTTYQPRYAIGFAAAAAINLAIYAPRAEHVRGILFAVAASPAATAGDPRSP